MPHGSARILATNPGSTSTKFGVYTKDGAEIVRTVRHTNEDLVQFRGRSVLDQLDYRADEIKSELQEAGYGAGEFAAVVGRGGLLPPVTSGTYVVDDQNFDLRAGESTRRTWERCWRACSQRRLE
jgi:butyrate kinase